MLLPSSSHSLTAARRMAVVTAVLTGPPPKVTVQLGGDDGTSIAAGDTQDLPFLDSYLPTVGDVVATSSVDGDHLVLGKVATNSTPYFSIAWAGHTINTGANQVSFATTDPYGGWDGVNSQYTLPVGGLWQVSGVWRFNAAHAVAAADLWKNGSRILQGPYDTGLIDTGPQYHGVFAFVLGDILSIRTSVGGTGATFANYFTATWVGRT